eukprot:scaffold111470_cov31-Tisochrysis_lutea.AAC.2
MWRYPSCSAHFGMLRRGLAIKHEVAIVRVREAFGIGRSLFRGVYRLCVQVLVGARTAIGEVGAPDN